MNLLRRLIQLAVPNGQQPPSRLRFLAGGTALVLALSLTAWSDDDGKRPATTNAPTTSPSSLSF